MASPEQIELIEPNVHRIALSGSSTLYLIGTAHVSEKSADLVQSTIEQYRPNQVAVELCEPRLQAIQDPERWQRTDIFEVIRSGKAYVLLAQLLLASFQKRIAKKLGIRPGEEMLRALSSANDINAEIALIDREVRTTLKRAWATTGLWSTLKVVASMISSLFIKDDEISEDQIEQLKEGDALSSLLAEFSDVLPGVKKVLIDERDQYMAAKLSNLEGETIVAIVGAGHVPGILDHLGETIDIARLEEIPPPRRSLIAIAWGFPILVLSVFAYGFLHSGTDTGIEMFSAWFLANGLLSALGALLALAHPLTILAAFVAAPFTSLNPTIAAGWVCGLVEAILRKPRVSDFETIADDIATFKGIWGNRLSRILLIVVLANLGSVLGTLVGSAKIVALLQ